MEKETFISKFIVLAEEIKKKYGVNLWLVEVLGKRHSYLAGHKEDGFLPPEPLYLNERFAVVSNEWEKIPEHEKETLIKILKEELLK
ncbi:hypothetical protein F1847_07565 [Thermodesulfobacterium sp. TA1]|uniref:hypothetical protein n=1 Tax=Thermodesulfobacterium sp. TA1 TaxID=2234087 RepID=UPI001232D22C|nr:hypothetical protein [Thermodesulfobacterium sp. TA1]QER42603.1 hypothetical protein F1847_07565 [Thermodesulfobacterium sp. TA1]